MLLFILVLKQQVALSVLLTSHSMIDGLVKVADKRSFWELVKKVFTNGQINWGRIIVLFYSVGKLSAKVLD